MTIDTHDSLKEAYNQTRTKALGVIERLNQIATQRSPEVSQRLTQRYDNLREMLYRLTIIGRHNVGRRTLLNVLRLPLVRPVGVPLIWTKLRSQFCSASVVIADLPFIGVGPPHDKATLEALLEADAVLFVLRSTELLGFAEEEYLGFRYLCDGIEARGIRDTFFLVNAFEDLEEPMTAAERDRMHRVAWERLVREWRQNSQPYQGQSEAECARYGVFFVNAHQALRGKLDGDQARVDQSGLPFFEAALIALVYQRLYANVHRIVSQTLADATALHAYLVRVCVLLQVDRRRVEQNLQEIRQRLAYLEARRRTLEDACQRDVPDTRQAVQAALLREFIGSTFESELNATQTEGELARLTA
jgi:hypothetical protein